MSTIHANAPDELASRLETMALMSDVDLPVAHIREQIAAAIDLIVQTVRQRDGRRLVTRLAAVEGLRDGRIALRDVVVRDAAGARPPILSGMRGAG